VNLGTPSEVLAGRILERILQVREIKFIDRAFDFKAVGKNGLEYSIEVKAENILRVRQMEALAEEFSKGKVALLFIIDEKSKHYCLFRLIVSDLFVTTEKKDILKESESSDKACIIDEEFLPDIAQVISNNRITISRKIINLLKLKEGNFIDVRIRKI